MSQRPRIIHHQLPIDRVLTDPALLGASLSDLSTWTTWIAILKAAFGLPLDQTQRATFGSVAGGRPPPTRRVREFWCVAGRRSAKSRMAGALGVYLACFGRYRLAPGERGLVLCLAATVEQAKVVFDYAKSFMMDSPILAREVDTITSTEIRLKNGLAIATHPNSFRSIRGRSLCGVVLDEVALWRDELSAQPDTEVYTSVLPSLLTTKGMLIGISTGYRRTGLLYQQYRDHFGQDHADTLVVQGSTLQFNQTLTEADLAAQIAADPSAAEAEWRGGFRDDISGYLTDALLEAAIEHGRPLELPPLGAVAPSGVGYPRED